jgi:hypothetical protein
VANKNVLQYERTGTEGRLLVVLNMVAEPTEIDVMAGMVLASTHLDREGAKVGGSMELRAAEGLVITVQH